MIDGNYIIELSIELLGNKWKYQKLNRIRACVSLLIIEPNENDHGSPEG